MAKLIEVFCAVCKETKRECVGSGEYPTVCSQCASEEKSRKEREWKAGREGLTIEERLRELENFMYHHGKHYNGPTRF